MVSLETRVHDIENHVYIGEYDNKGIIGKLYDNKIYTDMFLGHKDCNKKGISLYIKYTFFFEHDDLDKLIEPCVNDDIFDYSYTKSIGQGMIGAEILAKSDATLGDYIDLLGKVYVKVKLQKNSPRS